MRSLKMISTVALASFVFASSYGMQVQNFTRTFNSPYGVEKTVHRLENQLSKHHFNINAVMNIKALAKKEGMNIPATTLILSCQPKYGAYLVKHNRNAALFLPIKFMVWSNQDTGQVKVRYWDPKKDVAQLYSQNNYEINNRIDAMSKKLANMVRNATN